MARDGSRLGRVAGQALAGAAKRVVGQGAKHLGKQGMRLLTGVSSGGTSVAAELGWQAAKRLWRPLLALVAIAVLCAVVMVIGIAAVAGGSGTAAGGASCAIEDEDVPGELIPIYGAAAARFGLGPRGAAVLAAVNRVETGFGRDNGPSDAGAIGPMQFLPGTWAKGHSVGETRVVVAPTRDDADGYATDGDDDGVADSDEPADAIHSAARLLHAHGAPRNWDAAIFSYNHSAKYVADVLAFASRFAGLCTETRVDAPLTDGPRATLAFSRAGTAVASVPASAPQPVKDMVAAANEIANTDYVWGGGHHGGPPTKVSNYDCSGAVAYVLHAGGLIDRVPVALDFMTWGVAAGTPGAGGWVVVYANKGHVWMTIAGLVFDNYGSRGRRPMWSSRVVEKVSSYVARRPPVGWPSAV